MNNPLQITIKCSVCMQIYLMERYSIFGQELHTWPPKFLPPFLIILPPLWSGIFRSYKHAIFFFFQLFLWYICYFFLVYNRATTYHPRSISKEKGKKKQNNLISFIAIKLKSHRIGGLLNCMIVIWYNFASTSNNLTKHLISTAWLAGIVKNTFKQETYTV